MQHCPLLVIDGGHVLGVGLELPVELGGAFSKDALQERRLQWPWFEGHYTDYTQFLKWGFSCEHVSRWSPRYKDAKRTYLVL